MKNSWMSRQYWMQNLNKTRYSAFLFEFFISVRNQKISIQFDGVKWPLYMPCIENLIVLNKFNIRTLSQSLTEKMHITQRIMGMPRALGQLGNRLGRVRCKYLYESVMDSPTHSIAKHFKILENLLFYKIKPDKKGTPPRVNASETHLFIRNIKYFPNMW